MTDKQILKSIRALARDECANYKNGFCLETDKRCHLINKNYDTVHDGTIDCDYFLECVLPADWDLNDLVAYALWYDDEDDEDALPSGMKRCEICDQPFTVMSNHQKYCHACSEVMTRRGNTERKRRSRS